MKVRKVHLTFILYEDGTVGVYRDTQIPPDEALKSQPIEMDVTFDEDNNMSLNFPDGKAPDMHFA